MSYALLQRLLWMAPIVIQAALVAIIFARRLHRTFPAFLTYSTFVMLSAIYLFLAYERLNYPEYFYRYWGVEAVSIVLSFVVIWEIFRVVFRSYETLSRFASSVFLGLVAILLIAAIVIAFVQPAREPRLVQVVLGLSQSLRLVQCGLLLFLLVFSSALGITLQESVFGIALGYGIFAIVDLPAVALRLAWGRTLGDEFSLVRAIAYNLGAIVWLIYFSRSELVLRRHRLPANDLQHWNDELRRFLHR